MTIEQKWRTAAITILEGNPPAGSANGPMSRAGAVQNQAMSAARTSGLGSPLPLLDQVRLNPRQEILKSWTSSPTIVAPEADTPDWTPWLPADNKPLHARYGCQQGLPDEYLHPNAKWRWTLNGEQRIFRIVCSAPAPEDLTRHFLKVKRQRRWLGSEDMPEWTYDHTTVVTLTIPQGSTTGGIADGATPRPVDLNFPDYAEKNANQTVHYIAKATEIEEIYLPVEIQSPTRQAGGTMLGKIGGLRPQIYAPELRIAKLFPGKDAADATYAPIQSASPFAIVPEEDPDSYIIRVHDTSGVWKQLANPTAKPGIRITTTSPSPYQQFYSDQSDTNQALFQVDGANPTMAPGWLATKSMFLVSNREDNIEPAGGPINGTRNDLSRRVLPGGTVNVAFPGWQRSTSPIPVGNIISFNLPVPIAAKATLDMKMFRDADVLSPTNSTALFKEKLEAINEHYAQVGVVFDKTPDATSIPLASPLDSQILYFYIPNQSSKFLTRQVRDLAQLAGRVTGNGVEPNVSYGRTDAHLGILFCANQLGGGSSPGLALPSFGLESSEQAFNGNFFHSYITNSGDISGYNSRIAAHEVGHLLTNKGHFGGPASTGNNYQSLATTEEKGYNLMTEGPWGTLTWPFTHQRLGDEQENYIFTRGAIWLRNP